MILPLKAYPKITRMDRELLALCDIALSKLAIKHLVLSVLRSHFTHFLKLGDSLLSPITTAGYND